VILSVKQRCIFELWNNIGVIVNIDFRRAGLRQTLKNLLHFQQETTSKNTIFRHTCGSKITQQSKDQQSEEKSKMICNGNIC
jgi:hypothetical protein